VRLFQCHQKTKIHREFAARCSDKRQQTITTVVPAIQSLADDHIWTRISTVHLLASEDIPIHKYSKVLDNKLVDRGYEPAVNYHNDKAAWEIAVMISKHLRTLLKNELANTPYFGIMIDETTDVSTTQQLIIYIKYLKKEMRNEDDASATFSVAVEYLDLVTPVNCTAEEITVSLLEVSSLIIDCNSGST
jgi:hypothetical protein